MIEKFLKVRLNMCLFKKENLFSCWLLFICLTWFRLAITWFLPDLQNGQRLTLCPACSIIHRKTKLIKNSYDLNLLGLSNGTRTFLYFYYVHALLLLLLPQENMFSVWREPTVCMERYGNEDWSVWGQIGLITPSGKEPPHDNYTKIGIGYWF